MIIPPQVHGKLHVYEIPTIDDIQNLISNGKSIENIVLLHHWIAKIDDKARRLKVFITIWDDAVFLGAIEWDWFLQELAFNSYMHSRAEKST